jgi:hypothetical protein
MSVEIARVISTFLVVYTTIRQLTDPYLTASLFRDPAVTGVARLAFRRADQLPQNNRPGSDTAF